MKEYIRLGGAQIPCSKDIRDNVSTIKKSIDWAVENSIDYLLTPEASLSGYADTFADDLDLLKSSLKSIEDYAKERKIGLFLGTLWIEDCNCEPIKRNQIRFYDKNGVCIGVTNKIILTPYDTDLGIEPDTQLRYFVIKEGDHDIPVCGFICNDFYGKGNYPNLTDYAYTDNIKIFIHSTNAERNKGTIHQEVFNDWHNAHFRLLSYLGNMPIITVDNCWHMDGEPFDGPTSSISGLIISGEWKVQAPRIGTQYFYYDLPIEKLLERNWK